MIGPDQVKEIIGQYERHGWELRLVLAPGDPPVGLRHGTDVKRAEIEALWFSRPSRSGGETWELRRLSGSPYALLEVIPEGATDEIRRVTLAAIEERMAAISRPRVEQEMP